MNRLNINLSPGRQLVRIFEYTLNTLKNISFKFLKLFTYFVDTPNIFLRYPKHNSNDPQQISKRFYLIETLDALPRTNNKQI